VPEENLKFARRRGLKRKRRTVKTLERVTNLKIVGGGRGDGLGGEGYKRTETPPPTDGGKSFSPPRRWKSGRSKHQKGQCDGIPHRQGLTNRLCFATRKEEGEIRPGSTQTASPGSRGFHSRSCGEKGEKKESGWCGWVE